ncbi:unnamed protein product [Lepeophtheirus salmonis]|uniref:(salmon louse) hypothetical protein n=1 Tax=Lepeophtheirus salmonis TaxID=72036 RepID=A0A7R8CSQ4_LEPSM|nr:unnamed protein product [Lepeophtheirus salmonis]CAF2919162.1 unnamed protein product [Lepeophtheirus salmonis]
MWSSSKLDEPSFRRFRYRQHLHPKLGTEPYLVNPVLLEWSGKVQGIPNPQDTAEELVTLCNKFQTALVKNASYLEDQMNVETNCLLEQMRALLSQSTTAAPHTFYDAGSFLASQPTTATVSPTALVFPPTFSVAPSASTTPPTRRPADTLQTPAPMRRQEVAPPSPLKKNSRPPKSKSCPIQQTFDSSVTGVTTGMLHREPKTLYPSLANNKYRASLVL